jgi:hypothetical protein
MRSNVSGIAGRIISNKPRRPAGNQGVQVLRMTGQALAQLDWLYGSVNMIQRFSWVAIALVSFWVADTGQAQTIYYKCTPASGGAPAYSDTPCRRGESEVRVIAAPVESGQPSPAAAPSPAQPTTHERQARLLDAKVAEAISSGDLSRAKGLALTAEHWQMITAAERGGPAPVMGRTSADLRADARNSRECKEAQWSYDVDSSSSRKDAAVIGAARRRMYSACGMDEPQQINNRIYIQGAPPAYRPR